MNRIRGGSIFYVWREEGEDILLGHGVGGDPPPTPPPTKNNNKILEIGPYLVVMGFGDHILLSIIGGTLMNDNQWLSMIPGCP